MKMNAEKRTIIIIALFSFLILLITFLVILPTMQEIRDSKKSVEDLQNYMERRLRKVAAVKTSLSQLKNIDAAASEFSGLLFRDGEELKLITDLENLAHREKVTQTIVNSNLDNITDKHLKININISGLYINTLKYLAELERLPYFITIEELQLTPLTNRGAPTEAPKEALLNLRLGLYVD
ncbi:MAG: hypothetical protein Q7K39_01360 [Candidatus Magasanikbacteria bacterium]|nr:hypothetical protein [Candidatus Magasanikbacteria bacterium]